MERKSKRATDQETPVTEVRLCTLCESKHAHMSAPSTWKNERARLLARELNVPSDGEICRSYRDDISRLLRDFEHKPRWNKQENKICSMPEYDEVAFAKTNIATS